MISKHRGLIHSIQNGNIVNVLWWKPTVIYTCGVSITIERTCNSCDIAIHTCTWEWGLKFWHWLCNGTRVDLRQKPTLSSAVGYAK